METNNTNIHKTTSSLRTKISGTFIALLGIMLIVVVFSYLESNKVDRKLALLAETVIPLTNHVANLDTAVLEQTIVVKEILRLKEGKNNEAEVKRLIERFRGYDQQVRTGLAEAELIVHTRLQGELSRHDLLQLATITPLLNEIADEHQDFSEHMEATITQTLSPDPEVRRLIHQQLESHVDRLDRAVRNVLSTLETLSEHQSQSVLFGELSLHHVSLLVGVLTFFVGALLSPVAVGRIIRPLKHLSDGAKQISAGDLSVEIPVQSTDEVGELTISFNAMAQELKTKEAIKTLFGKYVDPRIVEDLIAEGGEQAFSENAKQEMTIFFSDIAGFSTISESLTPNSLVRLMNLYFTHVSQPIYQHNGVIDKFIGDAVMAFWGPPFTTDNHAKQAAGAALEYVARLNQINAEIPDLLGVKKDPPVIDVRIGLCTGDVIAGSIGSTEYMSYTVFGDSVNIAARLESANKKYGTRIIMEQSTQALIDDRFETRKIDQIRVVGIHEPLEIFELLGEKSSVEPPKLDLKSHYEAALASYLSQNWQQAQEHLEQCLTIEPGDRPSQVIQQRIEDFHQNPPPDDWDGVWQLDSK